MGGPGPLGFGSAGHDSTCHERQVYNRPGCWRNSTTSWSSARTSSTPATSSHATDEADDGVISTGFVFGIIRSMRQLM